MKELVEADYQKLVVENDKLVIIDFWAEWCGPCKQLAPVLEKIAKEYEGKVDFYKTDVAKDNNLISTHNVKAIPLLLFVKNGIKIKEMVGHSSRQHIIDTIEECLN
jgi:thioredoxin 1